MAEVLQLAHRGALEQRTENTLAAFERALELGADGVELDVMLSADGEVVVFHDEDLVRLAGRSERIDALSWEQLRAVDLHGGGRIPRLAEVVDQLPQDAWLDVELKAGGSAMVDATVALLSARDNCLLSSFDPRLLARAREQNWPAQMGLLLERQSPAFLHAHGGREFGAQGVILDAAIVSAPTVERYARSGYLVGVYGARDEEHERALIEMGIGWLITDWPRRFG
jgi:glycerophosphoryl diester phosphodiesterase